MESPPSTELEPFGRQPKPVLVTISGEDLIDVNYWLDRLARRAEFKGDSTNLTTGKFAEGKYQFGFTIHPRAVND